MKTRIPIILAALALACSATLALATETDKDAKCTCDTPAVATDDKATAAIPADYPLTTCVVSGHELGKKGAPIVYTYKQAGQPDRTIVFCCPKCIAAFEKNPAKYLATLDAASAKQ